MLEIQIDIVLLVAALIIIFQLGHYIGFKKGGDRVIELIEEVANEEDTLLD